MPRNPLRRKRLRRLDLPRATNCSFGLSARGALLVRARRNGKPVVSHQLSVFSEPGVLTTDNWQASFCYAFDKCGELLVGRQAAGRLGVCCWSCSSRPLGRWRWPRQAPCTARARWPPRRWSRRRCHAITRWHMRSPGDPSLRKPRSKQVTVTAARTIAVAALLHPSGRNPLPACSHSSPF